MLIRLLRRTGPGIVILIFLTALALWSSAFINPNTQSSFHFNQNPMPLYIILKSIIGGNGLSGVLFSFILVLIMSVLLVNFNTAVFFINERTFFPAIIYVLLSALFPDYQTLNPVLPSSVFLIIALRRIMDAYKVNGTAFSFFDASFLLGTGSLFYANLIWFGVLTIIGIAILRTVGLKEIMISILGLCTPYFLTFGILYVAGKDLNSLKAILEFNLFDKAGGHPLSNITITGLIVIGSVVMISIFRLLSGLNSMKIKSRKTFIMLFWAFIISVAVFFVLPSASSEIIWIMSIPASYILSYYFVLTANKLVPEICFMAIVVMIVIVQIQHIS